MKTLFLLTPEVNVDIFNKGLALIQIQARSINLSLELTVKNTTTQFTSIPFKNDVNANGYIVNPTEIANEELKYGTFDTVCLIFDSSKMVNPASNPAENQEYLQLPIGWYQESQAVPPEQVMASYFWHETSHYFAWKTQTYDWTHLLQHRDWNPTMYGQWGNSQPIDFYLYLIAKLMPSTPQSQNTPTGLVVTIKLSGSDGVETFGKLSVQIGTTSFSCLTLENKSLQVAAGTYLCKWSHTLHFPFGVFQLQNVVGRSGIDIHSGSYFTDSKGCILLGRQYNDVNEDSEEDLIDSKSTVKAFDNLMNKKDFTLQII